MYLDGRPIGVLRYGELPTTLQPIWESHKHVLPFRAGEPTQYRETKVPRYRITDYLAAVHLRLDDITEVHLHGGRDSAIVLTRDDLRRHPDDLLFKFAGDTFGKPIPMIRAISVGTTFDDLRAMTIYINKKPPRLTADQTLELDGYPVRGIPYHGEPLRNGVRVYIDDRLAVVLKRNQLAATTQRFQLTDILEREGVVTDKLARIELIRDEVRTRTLAWADLDFAFDQSGSISLGVEATPADSLAIYTAKL